MKPRTLAVSLVLFAGLVSACSGPSPPGPDTVEAPPAPSPVPTPAAEPVASPTGTPAQTQAAAGTRPPSEARTLDLGSGGPAPDFELTLLDGDSLRMSDLRGQVVVLNFWGSWCGPCRWEMPSFENIWQEYKDRGVVFVGVAVLDFEENARAFAEEAGVTYPLGLDVSGKIAEEYGVSTGGVVSVPTTFLIDREGNRARRFGIANEAILRIFLRGQIGSQ